MDLITHWIIWMVPIVWVYHLGGIDVYHMDLGTLRQICRQILAEIKDRIDIDRHDEQKMYIRHAVMMKHNDVDRLNRFITVYRRDIHSIVLSKGILNMILKNLTLVNVDRSIEYMGHVGVYPYKGVIASGMYQNIPFSEKPDLYEGFAFVMKDGEII